MTKRAARLIAQMGAKARQAAKQLAHCPSAQKRKTLDLAAQATRNNSSKILAANMLDREAADESGLPPAMLDRLLLTEDRVEAMAASIEQVAALPDPIGTTIKSWTRPNGLIFERIRVPIGVIGMIYESRPNVTADAASLCLMSGNAVILRGGSEAVNSNRAIHGSFIEGLREASITIDAVQLVPTSDRTMVGAMLGASQWLDLLIPRGGKGLLQRVMAEARVPLLGHMDGNCHVYVDRDADPDKALDIVLNSKLRRTGVCGAAETILFDCYGLPFAPVILSGLLDAGCEVRGDAALVEIDRRITLADEVDWKTEFLAPVIAAKVVEGVDDAVDHINRYGSGHTDCIVTENDETARIFLDHVDSAIVIHNASTQFADGGEFGFGAEIGIATGRVQARGPVGLEEMTTYKSIMRGNGHTRP